MISFFSCKKHKLKNLAIYYGWPSLFNKSSNLDESFKQLSKYSVIIFGAGLENEKHGDHGNTKKLILGLNKASEVYGYITIGSPTNLSYEEIENSINRWKEMGVTGIFLDEAGYDFKTSRERQNRVIELIHKANLKAFINAYDPDDVFATKEHHLNLKALKTSLKKGDSYLYESFGIVLGEREKIDFQQNKLRKLKEARKLGVRVFGVTTSNKSEFFDPKLWEQTIDVATKYKLDGLGWGEHEFSAPNNIMPFRDVL